MAAADTSAAPGWRPGCPAFTAWPWLRATAAVVVLGVEEGSALAPVRRQLDRYSSSAALGPGGYYRTPGEALGAFHATQETASE